MINIFRKNIFKGMSFGADEFFSFKLPFRSFDEVDLPFRNSISRFRLEILNAVSRPKDDASLALRVSRVPHDTLFKLTIAQMLSRTNATGTAMQYKTPAYRQLNSRGCKRAAMKKTTEIVQRRIPLGLRIGLLRIRATVPSIIEIMTKANSVPSTTATLIWVSLFS